MLKSRATVIVLACAALLITQAVGLHHHVDGDGHSEGLQAGHLQHTGSPEHDHGDEIDASKLELGNVWSKTILLIALAPALFLSLLAPAAKNWLPSSKGRKSHWRLYWRPFLRAPPACA